MNSVYRQNRDYRGVHKFLLDHYYRVGGLPKVYSKQ